LFRDGDEPILYAPEHRREYERTRPLKTYAEYALPVDFERNEIFVHTDMHFAGITIATNHVAIEFSDFCRGLPLVPITRPPVARRPRGASTAAVASILDEFPWLELEDLVPQRARAAVARRHDARGPRLPVGDEGDADDDGGLDGDDTDDELPGLVDLAPPPLEDEPPAVIDVVGDLADARIGIANADERYYRATVLGGVWTANHVGEAADAAMGMARNGIATRWAQYFKFPKSKRFHFSRYGRADARMLAQEFARRGNFFCALFVQSGLDLETFNYTQAMVNLYVESEEFIEWLLGIGFDNPAFDMGVAVRHLVPDIA
jgi:hypothetical protein